VALSAQVIQVNGVARRVLLAAPSGTPSIIVLSLHGSRSSPEGQARLSRMEALTQYGAVVAFPQGSVPMGSGFEWDLENDAQFLLATADTLREQFPEAQPRVCMSGMSGGARMSSRFGAGHPDKVMLVGAIAGLRAPSPPSLERQVRVVAFHGSADRINPFGGGTTARWDESVLDAAKAWAAANGHSTEPESEEITRSMTRHIFGAQEDPGAVTLWVSKGAGHTWPGSRLSLPLRLFLGRTSNEIDATAEVWRAATALVKPESAP
jgi:polyhydroxybutyrate depolymerase